MRMTTRGLYALKAILTLAELSSEQKPVSLQRLAQMEGLSPEFLQQIFYKLRKAGIVKAARGPGGGFSLSRKPAEISVYDVLFAVGESLEISPCGSIRQTQVPCARYKSCHAAIFWTGMEQIIVEYAKSRYLSDLAVAKGPIDGYEKFPLKAEI